MGNCRMASGAGDAEWDAAYHDTLVRYITVQQELLQLRRTHESEVTALQDEFNETEAKLEAAEKTVAQMTDSGQSKQEKVKQLNLELAEVQGLLLETERDHKKLNKLRSDTAALETKSSEAKLENDKMREELKGNNRKLAAKQTELIGRRHELFQAQAQISQIKGEGLQDLETDEKAALKSKLEAGLAQVNEFTSVWVEKRRTHLTELMNQAARDMEFEKAAEYKADLMALSDKYEDPNL